MYAYLSLFMAFASLVISHHLRIGQMSAVSLMTEKLPLYFLTGAAIGIFISLLLILADYKNGVKGNAFVINGRIAFASIFVGGLAAVIVPLIGWLLWQIWFAIYKQVAVWLN
jgi:hypothetical protein